MKRIIELHTAQGTVPVEVDEQEDGDLAVVGPRQISGALAESFEAAVQRVKPAVAAVFSSLKDVATPANRIEVEFGIKIGIKTGVYIAAADAEGTFRIKMTWDRPER